MAIRVSRPHSQEDTDTDELCSKVTISKESSGYAMEIGLHGQQITRGSSQVTEDIAHAFLSEEPTIEEMEAAFEKDNAHSELALHESSADYLKTLREKWEREGKMIQYESFLRMHIGEMLADAPQDRLEEWIRFLHEHRESPIPVEKDYQLS